MEYYADYISKIEIQELWRGHKHIVWELDPEVNVLSGVNGVGKSTILHSIVSGVKSIKYTDGNIKVETIPADAELIRFDIISTPEVRSEFDTNLYSLCERYSEHSHEASRTEELYEIIDQLFASTEKTIVRNTNTIQLMQYGEPVDLKVLSSGEKQMLCILLTVYLQDQEPTVLFMDEPEVSLHMEWQQQLIEIIRHLNPKVQIILTTHSPAIIMNGWMDKVTEVNDITVG